MISSSPLDSLSEPAMIEQVIAEFFDRSLDVIVGSRSSREDNNGVFIPSPSPSLTDRTVVVDVIFNPQSPSIQGEKIVERWVLQYESESRQGKAIARESYERLHLLLQSLHDTARLLPAHEASRAADSSTKVVIYNLPDRIPSLVGAKMNQFSFSPIDTPRGILSVSVSYLLTLEGISSEARAPLATKYIADYIGSAMTIPVKRFHSLPSCTSSHGSGSDNGAARLASSSCPSRMSLASRALQYDPNYFEPPRIRMSDQSPSTSSNSQQDLVTGERNSGFNDYRKSPNKLLRSESASVSTASRPSQSSPCERKVPKKKELPWLGGVCMVLQKVLSFGKGGDGNLQGPSNSTQIPLSRSPIRSSSLHKFDESESVCPFAVDDKCLVDSSKRIASDGKGHESVKSGSHDAAVGALVHMLNTAPPLARGLSNTGRNSRAKSDEEIQHIKEMKVGELGIVASSSGITASGDVKPRTTSDALEEFRSYRDTKELLHKRGV